MPFCSCGVEIHPLRVKFLERANLPLTCIQHSTTEKVGGFMATKLYQASARAGTGVSKGVKMNQSFDAKYFKK